MQETNGADHLVLSRFFIIFAGMKKLESEVVEFLYEYMIRRAIPIVNLPATFKSYIALILNNRSSHLSSVIPFDRVEFEEILRMLIIFEKNTIPNDKNEFSYIDTRRLEQLDSHGEKILCYNNPRLFELYEFLQMFKTNFIISLKIASARMLLNQIEFLITIDGLTLMNGTKRMDACSTHEIMTLWGDICEARGWTDFSILINADGNNFILYRMLYSPSVMTELDS